ncbi:MAG: GNAT family N-acetyltransferase [Chloroflexi bacterium]|nr:GNAT family N-acetyltransferase [Chloroflexota bacterium]
MSVTFERAHLSDAETMVQVQIASFHYDSVLYPGVEEGGPPGYDSVDVMRQKINEDECFKILYEDRCVGGIVVFDMGDGHYHLDVIFLDPAYQNYGIGTYAMQFIEQIFPARLWTLDTPQWAVRNQHFYEKFGYRIVSEHEHDGTPLFAYEKWIDPD